MSDTSFGGGLDLGPSTGPVSVGGAPLAGPGSNGADVPPAMPSAPPAPQARGPQDFGSSLKTYFMGPTYAPPDPQASALDQSADLLQQRVKRANEVAADPIRQFFDPGTVQKARDFVPKAAEALQTIRTQQAAIAAGKQQAATLGLNPGEVADEATQADRVQAAVAGALKGDLNKFRGLQVVDPKTAETIQDQVAEVAGGHMKNAQLAFDSLSGMTNSGQYDAKVNELRKNGTLSDLEALGLKVPPTFDAFNAGKAAEGKALRDARIGLDTIRNKLEARNTFQPMEEKEAKTYESAWKTVYGDEIKTQPSRNAATNARGGIIDGYDDPRKLGKGAVLATPEQRKSIKEDAELAVSKQDLEKFRGNNRLYGMATTMPDGTPIPSGGLVDKKGNKIFINTNPNVQQGIAEGLAAALRGGMGGATAGLLGIETSKRGYIQGLLDKIASSYAGGINTLSTEQVKPYLTQLTQSQMRDVLDYLKSYNNADIGNRLSETAKRAGALGLSPAALGLGPDENAATAAAVEEGRKAQIALDMQRHQAIGGGRGMLAYGALKPTNEGTPSTAPGSTPTTQLPPPGLQTPVQQATQPGPAIPPAPGAGPGAPPPVRPAPAATQPPGPSGGGTPVTIAGQPVSTPAGLPPGVTPRYFTATQRIESGNERDPWKAGNDRSSAGGAFQFISSTWAANKPEGAPARAKDATPQQQTEAAANLLRSNAASLAAARLPVNDTTMYMAHNLGAGGATSLLSAPPTADARTVVGEEAARNNPLFFKGRPTVATVMQRYQDEMNVEPGEPPGPRPGVGGATAQPPTLMQRINSLFTQGVPEGERAKATADVGAAAAEHAPAILGTLGAAGGTAAGGPVGGVVGGGVGSGAGQMVKDYIQGRPQSPTEIAKQTALGSALGIASEVRPVLAAAARVGGPAVIEGGSKAVEGGDVADIADATVRGGAYGLGGEVLGRFVSALGPAAHKVVSLFTPNEQAKLAESAGRLVAAREVLKTEQPKLATGGDNPKYAAAQKAEEEATQHIKDRGQNPDDMAYAYEQVKGGTSAGEAMTMRGANAEKAAVGEGYNQLREDVRGAAPNEKNIKPNQALPDGPVAQIRTPTNPTGKVPEVFRADAEHAEMLATAPAKDWGEKWSQLQDAGSELIKKRMAFLTNGDKPSAEAMDSIFQGVRNQQKAVAERLFGKERGAEVIAHLENLDTRYAKIMSATAGMKYENMRTILAGGNTPARRELEANFREFAKDDPSALRAFNAMKAGAKGDWKTEAALMSPIIAGEVSGFIPTLGAITAAVGGYKLYNIAKNWANAKILGKPVTFKDFAKSAYAEASRTGALNAAGNAAQRAVVQEQPAMPGMQ